MEKLYRFRELTGLTRALQGVLVANLVILAVQAANNHATIQALERAISGAPWARRQLATVLSNQSTPANLIFVLAIAETFLFWTWLYYAHLNARALGAVGFSYRPCAVVGYLFVPIANLFMPYRILKQTFQASHPESWQTGWEYGPYPKWLLPWWIAWILSIAAGRYQLRSTMTLLYSSSITAQEYLRSLRLDLFTDLLDLALGVGTLSLVVVLHRWQQEKHRRQGAPDTEPNETKH